jgi:hypothetical protein
MVSSFVCFNIAFNIAIARIEETLYISSMKQTNYIPPLRLLHRPQLLARPLLRPAR